MLRFDPFFRDLDRITQQLLGGTTGTASQPAVMPMDVWRDKEQFVVELDLPGAQTDSIEVSVDNDVLTVRAERPAEGDNRQWLASERVHGVFNRQIYLGTGLDSANIQADYTNGVLRLTIPVAEQAKPRKIAVAAGQQPQAINA